MNLILACPKCGGHTISNVEYSYGFTRIIYSCTKCNWTNRYSQVTIGTNTTSGIDVYPAGIYYTSSTNGVIGGQRYAR